MVFGWKRGCIDTDQQQPGLRSRRPTPLLGHCRKKTVQPALYKPAAIGFT